MRIFEYFEKISILLKLISQETTGTPDELANRLRISRTTLYEIINEIKSRNICISYSRTRRTFYYSSDARLEFVFKINDFSYEEMEKINGGTCIFASNIKTYIMHVLE